MVRRPVILLIFANEYYKNRHLDFLNQEMKEISSTFQGNPWFEVISIPNASVDDVIEKFRHPDLENRIVALHYGGHADSETLMLMNGNADTNSLAKFLSHQQNFQFVFLNGCSTGGQIQELLEEKIDHIIATERPIQDQRAFTFATYFYRELSKDPDIGNAFQQAKHALQVSSSDAPIVISEVRTLTWEDKPSFNVSSLAWKWFIREHPDQPTVPRRLRSSFILQQLKESSLKYFEFLIGPNGRFRYVRITKKSEENQQAEGNFIQTPLTLYINSEGQEKERSEDVSLFSCLSALWAQKYHHTFLTGQGGAGKTLSMLRLWHMFVTNSDHYSPIPLFVPLDKFNPIDHNRSPRTIIQKIIQQYFPDASNPNAEKEFLTLCDLTFPDQKPFFILLLDGYDDLIIDDRIDKGQIFREMQLLSQKKGLQLVISSRHVLKFQWSSHFHHLELQPLTEGTVKDHLKDFKIPMPVFPELTRILCNPMMLNLYITYADARGRWSQQFELDFKPNMESVGELLWNFAEARLASIRYKHQYSWEELQPYHFIQKHLLPYIAYHMELNHQTELNPKIFKQHINDFLEKFEDEQYARSFLFDLHPDYVHCVEAFHLGKLDFISATRRFLKLLQICKDELKFILEELGFLRFSHRNFRDFFAAVHILNEIQKAVDLHEIPQVLRERPLPYSLRKMIGEIEGEHHHKPKWIASEEMWYVSPIPPTLLGEMLTVCRNRFAEEELEYAVWNIISIWKEVRKDLSGLNLSYLNLRRIDFNSVSCSKINGSSHVAADFSGSLLNDNSFLPNGHKGAVYVTTFWQSGKEFASGGSDRTVKIWSFETGECLNTLENHRSSVSALAYHPFDYQLLSGSSDRTICLWELPTSTCIQTFSGHKGQITEIVWDIGGNWFVSSSKDGTLIKWDPKKGIPLKIYVTTDNARLLCLDINPALDLIIAGDNKGYLHFWKLSDGQYLHHFQAHPFSIRSINYHPFENKWISAGKNSPVKIWNFDDLQNILAPMLFGDEYYDAYSLSWHHDGSGFFVGHKNGLIEYWNISRNEVIQSLKGHQGKIYDLAFFERGSRLISGSEDMSIRSWSLKSGDSHQKLPGYTPWLHTLECHPNGERLWVGTSTGTIKVWNLKQQSCEYVFEGHSKSVRALAILEKGKYLLSASSDKTIKLWDTYGGLCLYTFQGHEAEVRALAVSKNQLDFISASNDNHIIHWDIKSGKVLNLFMGHGNNVTGVLYHPNGDKIISTSLDSTICVWSLTSGKLLSKWEGHESGIRTLAFHEENDMMLTGDGKGTVKLWSITDERCLATFQPHNKPIYSLILIPEDKLFLSAASDGSIHLTSIQTKDIIRSFNDHKGWVRALSLHPNQQEFFSTGYDGTIRRWSLKTSTCLTVFEHIPGIWTQGCKFNHLHHDSEVSTRNADLFKQHGAHWNLTLNTAQPSL